MFVITFKSFPEIDQLPPIPVSLETTPSDTATFLRDLRVQKPELEPYNRASFRIEKANTEYWTRLTNGQWFDYKQITRMMITGEITEDDL